MGIAQLLQLLFAVAPSVLDMMQKIEAAKPDAPGSEKKATVMAVVNAAATVVQAAPGVIQDGQQIVAGAKSNDVQAVSHGVSTMIDHFASALNTLGVFQPHAASAPAENAPAATATQGD